MSNYDSDILISNIKSHMSDKGVTQEKLADVLGMSQSNVSKALSTTDKKSFTLDQVIGIAKYFHVSIDSLIGENEDSGISVTPRSIAAFLVRMLEESNAEIFEYQKTEEVYDVDDMSWPPSCSHENRMIKYPAFYLPSYWYIPSNATYDEQAELNAEMNQLGNETSMKPINNFLHHFQEIFTIYKSGGLSEDTYRSVLSDMLSRLRN